MTSRDPIALVVAAMAAQEAGRVPEALAGFRAAVDVAPAMLDLRLMLAYAEATAGEREAARRTLDATPDVARMSAADARRVADAACDVAAHGAALAAIERALHFTPHDPDLHAARGAMLHQAGDVEGARSVLDAAVSRWPRHVPARMNRARLEAETGAYGVAIDDYARVLTADPSHAKARSYRGLLRLLLGEHADGWRDYEARRTLPFHTGAMPQGVPAWDGGDARGRTLLLWGEQGLGDQLMMARFASRLAERGARVVIRCHPALVALLSGICGVHAAVAHESELAVRVDAHVPMFSVPSLLGMDGDYGTEPYLAVPAAPAPERRHESGMPRIGVVWAGSPSHGNDHNRSLPAARLAALLDAPVHWISLQLGARREDLTAVTLSPSAQLTDAADTLRNFADTARLLASCDALLTVDTSVAHLGGALGVPTTVMLPFVPDWRWGLERRDSPWYGAVTLVRQPVAGDWDGVIAAAHRQILPPCGTSFRDGEPRGEAQVVV